MFTRRAPNSTCAESYCWRHIPGGRCPNPDHPQLPCPYLQRVGYWHLANPQSHRPARRHFRRIADESNVPVVWSPSIRSSSTVGPVETGYVPRQQVPLFEHKPCRLIGQRVHPDHFAPQTADQSSEQAADLSERVAGRHNVEPWAANFDPDDYLPDDLDPDDFLPDEMPLEELLFNIANFEPDNDDVLPQIGERERRPYQFEDLDITERVYDANPGDHLEEAMPVREERRSGLDHVPARGPDQRASGRIIEELDANVGMRPNLSAPFNPDYNSDRQDTRQSQNTSMPVEAPTHRETDSEADIFEDAREYQPQESPLGEHPSRLFSPRQPRPY